MVRLGGHPDEDERAMVGAPASAQGRLAAAQGREGPVVDDETALAEADLGDRHALACIRDGSHTGKRARELLLTFRTGLRFTTSHTG